MLTVTQVTKSFGGRTLFEDASLQINPGDRIGLIGANGAGKSTLFSLILGDNAPDEGTVNLQRGRTVGFLPQETAPSGEETVLQLATSISPAMAAAYATMREFPDEHSAEHHEASSVFIELDGYNLEAKAKRILSGLAFRDSDHHRPARTMSGGWIMRAHLARLLVMEPDLLMLDEPTNHLDLETLGWFQNHLCDYPGALLVISHDRAFLNAVCDGMVEISRQHLHRYRGNYDDYLVEKKARDEQYLSAYKNQQREIEHLQDFINRFRAKASKAAQAQERIKQLARIKRLAPPENSEATVKFRFPQPPRGGQRTMVLEHVRQAYGDHVVYEDLNLTVERGQRTVLVGPNGAGKSTLLKILSGLLPLEGGTLDVGRTVLEEAMDGASGVSEQSVRTVLGSFLFRGEDVFKKVGVLSGGEKSRLALVKLLLQPPNLLLLDEPTTHLDIASINALVAALQPYDGTLVFVSHDVHFIRSLATTVLHINAGRLTPYAGDYDYYLEKSGAASDRGGLVAALQNHRPAEKPAAPVIDKPKLGLKEIKQQRRAEAEARKAVAAALRQSQSRHCELEQRIMALEARQRELATILETAPNDATSFPLHRELADLTEELEQANEEWNNLSATMATTA
jgi:ATP-binding cassette subfamily F protein 3